MNHLCTMEAAIDYVCMYVIESVINRLCMYVISIVCRWWVVLGSPPKYSIYCECGLTFLPLVGPEVNTVRARKSGASIH